ncbi:hypothetical protein EF294_16895 [Gordonia oryzae]|uniref:WXG100 family type VII secretion target n=1 Tax=Gordonia oryzae TaxID=2487349 RepID=A0A3N4G6Z3_9ACTN|nr:hypothetical protein [Gordonia oryzae]RPA58075.1 hypothetical protein EF294_16895 [Gordonia oryzae]
MGLKISPQEAKAKLSDIKDKRDHAKQLLQKFADADVEMTGGAWQGDASHVHLQKTHANQEEFGQIIALLDRTVDAAETGINNAVAGDSH